MGVTNQPRRPSQSALVAAGAVVDEAYRIGYADGVRAALTALAVRDALAQGETYENNDRDHNAWQLLDTEVSR